MRERNERLSEFALTRPSATLSHGERASARKPFSLWEKVAKGRMRARTTVLRGRDPSPPAPLQDDDNFEELVPEAVPINASGRARSQHQPHVTAPLRDPLPI